MSEDRIRTEAVDTLLQVFANITDPDRIYALLQDLCTPREITDMAQRFEVAVLLSEGVHYNEISERTGASATTISRVSKCLNYGADGYRSIIDEGNFTRSTSTEDGDTPSRTGRARSFRD